MTTLRTSPPLLPGGPSPAEAQAEREFVRQALSGEKEALEKLAQFVLPTIQARVARALVRRRALYQGDARARMQDLVQDTFVELFRDGARVLRAWDPARGLTLLSFVGLLAEQRVLAFVRTKNAAARWEESEAHEDIATYHAPAWDPETLAASREQLHKLLDLMRAELSPLGRVLFERLIISEEDIGKVASDMGMSVSAVQAWSSRLKRRVSVIAEELLTASSVAPGKETPP